MTDQTVGFVGGGRVARIILGGWHRTGKPVPTVVVSDADPAVLQRLHTDFPSVTCTRDNRLAAAPPVVLFGLHPPAFPAMLEQEATLAMKHGALKTMTESGLQRGGVLDLIPVKPLAGFEPEIRKAYAETLGALHRKLVP